MSPKCMEFLDGLFESERRCSSTRPNPCQHLRIGYNEAYNTWTELNKRTSGQGGFYCKKSCTKYSNRDQRCQLRKFVGFAKLLNQNRTKLHVEDIPEGYFLFPDEENLNCGACFHGNRINFIDTFDRPEPFVLFWDP